MVAALLFPLFAFAVWQDSLFGNPAPAYFALAYPKLLSWSEGRYSGDLPPHALEYLRLCAKEAKGWYVPGDRRLARFQVRLSFDQAHLERRLAVRCLTENPSVELRALQAKFDAKALGLEFTFGSKAFTSIFADREVSLGISSAVTAYQSGAPAGFPLPSVVEAWSRVGLGQFRLELNAYVDGLAPPELRRDVEAYHREFGLLADTLLWEPSGKNTQVCFP
jgi:hypothetical protein